MKFIGNIIWLLLGGFIIALEYTIASILLMMTIIGIPFGLQSLKLARMALWPFGSRTVHIQRPTGCLGGLLNVFWIIFGGLAISISHLAIGVLFFLTIIGIPFGLQHFKMASLALVPFGKTIQG